MIFSDLPANKVRDLRAFLRVFLGQRDMLASELKWINVKLWEIRGGDRDHESTQGS